jgi:hypothetical protein
VNTSQGIFEGLAAKFNMLNVLLSNSYSHPAIQGHNKHAGSVKIGSPGTNQSFYLLEPQFRQFI